MGSCLPKMRSFKVSHRGFWIRRLTPAVLAALVCAGAALAAGQPDPKRMTLRLSDLPAGFAVVRKDTGRYNAARAAKMDSTASAAAYKAHGYLAGYELDAKENASLGDLLSGPFEITSSTSLYRAAAGARWSLARTVKAARKQHLRPLSTGGRIGAASHLYSYTAKKSGYTFRVYALGWRDQRVRATILIAGLKSAVSPREAVRLARKQERRIKAKLHS